MPLPALADEAERAIEIKHGIAEFLCAPLGRITSSVLYSIVKTFSLPPHVFDAQKGCAGQGLCSAAAQPFYAGFCDAYSTFRAASKLMSEGEKIDFLL